MIYFPPDFTAIPGMPGYFWNVKSKKLSSIKIGGELRELTEQTLTAIAIQHQQSLANRRKIGDKFYSLSHKGKKRTVWTADLMKLRMVDSTIPIATKV